MTTSRLQERERPIQSIAIRRAAADDLGSLLSLFQEYLCFYGLGCLVSNTGRFLEQRLELQDTIILMAWESAVPVGFTHLLPSWSSLGLSSIAILNDLFVVPHARGKRVATTLMKAAEREAVARGMTRLELVTAVGNDRAQSLYRKQRWSEVTGYITFEKTLPFRAHATTNLERAADSKAR